MDLVDDFCRGDRLAQCCREFFEDVGCGVSIGLGAPVSSRDVVRELSAADELIDQLPPQEELTKFPTGTRHTAQRHDNQP